MAISKIEKFNKMINELTKAQIQSMHIIAKEWIDLAHSQKYREKSAEDLVNFSYKLAGLKPPRILHADSPLGALLTIYILKNPQILGDSVWASVRASVGDSVWASVGASVRASVWASVRASVGDSVWASVWASVRDSVGDSVWASVGASVRASVGDSVWASVGDSVRDSVWDSVWDSVRDSVWDSVWDSVRASVWASVGDSVGDSVRDSVRASVGASVGDSVLDRCGYLNFSDFGWTGFYDFFLSNSFEFCKGNQWYGFKQWRDALKASNIFECYTYENLAVCVRPPKILKENGRLHSTTEAAIQFRDGYSQHYINGRFLPSWIWEEKEIITKERFLQEKNAEIRGGMYAVLGQKRVFDLIGAREVCRKSANDEVYVLYQTNEKIGDKYWQWVGVKCPSTATNYLLGVPETVTCPIEAVAGTFGLTASQYIINQHT